VPKCQILPFPIAFVVAFSTVSHYKCVISVDNSFVVITFLHSVAMHAITY